MAVKQHGPGFQKPMSESKPVGMAMIQTRLPEGADVIGCNCGWRKRHPRKKVREDAAEAHVDKKHNRVAVWL